MSDRAARIVMSILVAVFCVLLVWAVCLIVLIGVALAEEEPETPPKVWLCSVTVNGTLMAPTMLGLRKSARKRVFFEDE